MLNASEYLENCDKTPDKCINTLMVLTLHHIYNIICHGTSLKKPLLARCGLEPASLVSVNRHDYSIIVLSTLFQTCSRKFSIKFITQNLNIPPSIIYKTNYSVAYTLKKNFPFMHLWSLW